MTLITINYFRIKAEFIYMAATNLGSRSKPGVYERMIKVNQFYWKISSVNKFTLKKQI